GEGKQRFSTAKWLDAPKIRGGDLAARDKKDNLGGTGEKGEETAATVPAASESAAVAAVAVSRALPGENAAVVHGREEEDGGDRGGGAETVDALADTPGEDGEAAAAASARRFPGEGDRQETGRLPVDSATAAIAASAAASPGDAHNDREQEWEEPPPKHREVESLRKNRHQGEDGVRRPSGGRAGNTGGGGG
ncbi:unnamed protein product, partial [Pylaiella littoralis]